MLWRVRYDDMDRHWVIITPVGQQIFRAFQTPEQGTQWLDWLQLHGMEPNRWDVIQVKKYALGRNRILAARKRRTQQE